MTLFDPLHWIAWAQTGESVQTFIDVPANSTAAAAATYEFTFWFLRRNVKLFHATRIEHLLCNTTFK